MKNTPCLSKSRYLSGQQCEKLLWLQNHKPHEAEEPGPAQQRIFDQGSLIGELAQEEYPGGVLIEAPYNQTNLALEQTRAALDSDVPALFEACFLHKNTLVRADILQRNPDNTYNLIEVKSSSKVKPEHILDLAVQTWALESAGLKLGKLILMHVNTTCRYPNLSDFFTLEDLSLEVREYLPEVAVNLARYNDILHLTEEPDHPIGSHCSSPYICSFRNYCFKKAAVPKISIFNIPRLSGNKVDNLIDSSITTIEDIPEGYALSENQRRFVDLYKARRKEIDIPAIRDELSSLSFPLYFLDFETDNPALPWIDGLKPYEKFPFQYSLHIIDDNGEFTHTEYLHEEKNDPRPPLAEALLSSLRDYGTIIAYNASFEKTVIKDLGKAFPDLDGKLQALIPRFWDLLDIFKNHYLDPAFGGSNSIKAVLPVIFPDLSYKDLEVQNGTAAQSAWIDLIETDDKMKKSGLSESLRAYCYLDTLAMVRIYEVLKEL